MTRQELRTEAMAEILSDMGIDLTPEQVKQIAADFYLHIEMEREMESYQFIGGGERKCDKCESLKKEIKELNGDIEICLEGVRQRRRTKDVWIDRTYKTVMYKP